MSYTLGEAAKASGMSKAAISRAIKNGTITAQKQENGSYKIDPAELHRVYPAIPEQQARNRSPNGLDATELNSENRELRARLEAAIDRLGDKDSIIAELKADRDEWRQQAQRLAITGPQEKQARRWWQFASRKTA